MPLSRDSVRTVGAALKRRAESDGASRFVQYKDADASYTDVNRTANAIADQLQTQGIRSGDTVCLFLYNSLEYVYLYFALAKLGVVAVPVDTRFTGQTLATVLETADAEAIFVDGDTREAYEAVREDVSGHPMEYFRGPQQAGSLYRDFAPLLDGDSDTAPAVEVSGADTLSVTFVQRHAAEQPKGIKLPQYSYLNTAWEASQQLFDFSGEDRIFTTLPLYSIFAFQIGAMGALVTDAEFAFEDPFDPDVFWEQADRYDASVILYLGRILSVLYNQEGSDQWQQTPVETAIGHGFGFGTDETLIENFEQQFDITVLEGYGVTQATLTTYNTPDDRNVGSAGRPVSYAEIEVVDDNDWPVDAGEAGEIVIRPTRPNTMMQGYHGAPEATVKDCRNQWIHTGDIGYMDDDGYLHFVASEDNSIYRGRVAGRISSLEIESVIDAVDGVAESAVVGVEDATGTEEIKAVVVPTADASLDPVDIYRHCRASLPYLKVPRYIELRQELPRSPTGKVSKSRLRTIDPAATWDRDSGYEFTR